MCINTFLVQTTKTGYFLFPQTYIPSQLVKTAHISVIGTTKIYLNNLFRIHWIFTLLKSVSSTRCTGKKAFYLQKERNVWNWSFHGGHKLACKAPSSPGERFDPLSYNQKYSQNDVTWRRLSFLVHHSREWRHICSILKHISPQFWNIFLRFQKHQIFISHASCPTRWYLLTRIDEVSSCWLEILHFFEQIFWIHTNLRIKINKILCVWSAYIYAKRKHIFSPHMRFTQPI